MIFIADTNIVSELARAEPDAGVLRWWQQQSEIAVSAVTIEELVFGVERAKSQRRAALRTWLDDFLQIPPRVIAVDQSIAQLAGQLRAKLESKGLSPGQADTLIGATAIHAGRILVTRNTRDFAAMAVTTFNPFE